MRQNKVNKNETGICANNSFLHSTSSYLLAIACVHFCCLSTFEAKKYTQFLPSLHRNATRLLNSIACRAMSQASCSTSNTHSQRTNKRSNERTEKKLNWTVHAYKYKPYAMQCKSLQFFCKIKHANALHHQTALDFAAIAIDKPLNKPSLEDEKRISTHEKPKYYWNYGNSNEVSEKFSKSF